MDIPFQNCKQEDCMRKGPLFSNKSVTPIHILSIISFLYSCSHQTDEFHYLCQYYIKDAILAAL